MGLVGAFGFGGETVGVGAEVGLVFSVEAVGVCGTARTCGTKDSLFFKLVKTNSVW